MWSRIWKIEDKNLIKTSTWVSVVRLHRNDQKQTLKPPIRWSFLNSFPFLYQRSEGTGFPTAWHRNFTVLLAGTAWSCFSIFSGITHWGAIANEVNIMITIVCVCTDLCLKQQIEQRFEAYTAVSRCLLTAHWTVYFPPRMTHRLLRLQRI